ncbi:hypothetical protein BPC006_II3006 [Burkholderia pseudomallei BPC006]|uniref:Uncharacterized protein n=1 Tax=Burkholderia pseudomallei (strain 1710b) TaxID=320372 RepID=Q3JIP4_BURP1|nr:hypothetical protein BURPS1710b_A1402 [Burkholderia pseudomallei 1710b]AFR20929.1 hypothetical protein BPC006_II3006 [Burkholderia pseudomallei BPC006]
MAHACAHRAIEDATPYRLKRIALPASRSRRG